MEAKWILLIVLGSIVVFFVGMIPLLMKILTPDSTPANLVKYFDSKIKKVVVLAIIIGIVILGIATLIAFLV